MVLSSSRIAAALVARAARNGALMRSAPASHLLATVTAPAAAAHSVPWRRASTTSTRSTIGFSSYSTKAKGSKKKLPSLVIDEAFDGSDDGDEGDSDMSFGYELDDEQDQDHDEELSTELSTEPAAAGDDDEGLSQGDHREIAKQFRFAMDRKKEWMAQAAEKQEFDTILKAVYECYEHLYLSHPLLAMEECMLVDKYDDPVAAKTTTTKFRQKWYDDNVTKMTEQEAMALFVQAKRMDLASAIFTHREWIASTLGTITVPRKAAEGAMALGDQRQVDLTKHFRSFYSFAMGAYQSLKDHSRVFSIYETSLEKGVFPTANMTCTYLTSLLAKDEFAAVQALYEQIQKDERPVNLYFYRQVLMAMRVIQNSDIMTHAVQEMKIKGFKLRAEDYYNAIRALDTKYFLVTQKGGPRNGKLRGVYETYKDSNDRIMAHEKDPEKYAQIDQASAFTVKLFDEMVHDEQLIPHTKHFFPRVISAAVFLQDYERVNEYVDLYGKCFDGAPVTDGVALQMAVNALLQQDEPQKAWELILQTVDFLTAAGERAKPLQYQKGLGNNQEKKQDRKKIGHEKLISNVVEYLIVHKQALLLQELVDVLDTKRLLFTALTPPQCQSIMAALVHGTHDLDDEALYNFVNEKHWRIFPISVKPYWLTLFVNSCMDANRWGLVAKALYKRSRAQIPTIPPRIALSISQQVATEPTVTRELLELIAQLPKMVDLDKMENENKVTLVCNVVRALGQLEKTEQTKEMQKKRQRDIFRLCDVHLPATSVTLPADVQKILMQFV